MSRSVPLLLIAAATVGFLHSILPDHWVPLAVVARTRHWSLARVARTSFLASVGHVLTSLVLAAIIAVIGLQFRHTFEVRQGHIVGVILVLTGAALLLWALMGHGGHSHHHDGHHHNGHDHDDHHHDHGEHGHHHHGDEGSPFQRFAAIAGPFGAAASPDLTILPVALAASAIGIGAVVGPLISFSVATLATFVILTVAATIAGYQVKGEWLEEHGNYVTALVLIAIGVAVFLGL